MNKHLHTLKYIFFDLFSAIISWTLFFIYRKMYIESIKFGFELPIQFTTKYYLGIVFIPIFWITLYFLSGYYKDIYEKSAALMESLATNHPFIDGNKRVSFFVTDVYLRMNGYFIDCDSQSAYSFYMELFESNNFKFKYLLPWLKMHIKSL